MNSAIRGSIFLGLINVLVLCAGKTHAYDPLELSGESSVKVEDFDVHDSNRNRYIPVRIYRNQSGNPAPVVLFSHGLGGTREGSSFLGNHWASRGYVAVFVQHPGSDDSVWKSQSPRNRMRAMSEAASGENFSLRVADIPAVLDQLSEWNNATSHPLYQAMNVERVGMSGHSFGAVTTQAVSGQSFGMIGKRFTDARIKAAVAMSPSVPRVGNAKNAFTDVTIPWLLMTGTNDTAPIGNQTVESRLNVFPNLSKSIDRYQLVLNEAEHSVFTERELPSDKNKRNPNHHKAILAITTAFWDANLKHDDDAKDWLRSDATSVLEQKDRWQAEMAE